MKTIIIDDEHRARINLQLLLQEYCPRIEVVADCENLSTGVKAIRKLKPTVVFLDIEMPGHSGLELLDFFDENEIDFSIIFTTAYHQYAIQAFKFAAIDYLLKPINPIELVEAVKRLEKSKLKIESYQLLKENFNQGQVSKIAVPSGNSLLFIDTNQILYIKGEGAYAEVFCKNLVKHLVSRNLKNFEDILCVSSNFARVHKSYIVNLTKVVAYNKSDGGNLVLEENIHIPVSSDKAQLVLDKIKIIKR